MKNLYAFTISLTLLTSSQTLLAADIENGAELHKESCIRCHSGDLYAPENRKVKNLPALGKQVRFCKNNLGISWFDDEVSDVIGYLNKKHYKF